MRPAFLSRFFVKFLEVGGAGLASAVCAYGLGQIGRPAPATTAAAPIASVTSPVTEDAIRMARDDHALLVELARKGAEAPRQAESVGSKPPESVAPTAGAATSKPAKQASAAPPRRNQKQDGAHEARPRPADAKLAQSPPVLSDPAPRAPAPSAAPPGAPVGSAPGAPAADPGPARDAPAAIAANSDRPLLAKLRLGSSWFSPVDRLDVPRPPMPVGEFADSAM